MIIIFVFPNQHESKWFVKLREVGRIIEEVRQLKIPQSLHLSNT